MKMEKNLDASPGLLPCPCCGQSVLMYKDSDMATPTHCVACSNCGISTGWSAFHQMVVDTWNRRAETETSRKWKECWDRSVTLGLGGIPSMIAFIEAGVPDEVMKKAEYLVWLVKRKEDLSKVANQLLDYLRSLPRKKP